MDDKRELLLVAGMHRSGTSMVTSLCEAFGLALPKDLMPANSFNELGYFESMAVYRAHEEFLSAVGSCWYDIRTLSKEALSGAAAAVAERTLCNIVASTRIEPDATLAIKDPRISILMPVWLRVSRYLNLRLRVLVVVRDPMEVAMSLNKRDAINHIVGLSLWWHHYENLTKTCRELPNAVVSYEATIKEPWVLYDRLVSGLGLTLRGWDTNLAAAAAAKVSSQLRHHTRTGTAATGELAQACESAFQRLQKVGTIEGFDLSQSPNELDFVRGWFPEWRSLYERYLSSVSALNAIRHEREMARG